MRELMQIGGVVGILATLLVVAIVVWVIVALVRRRGPAERP